MAHGIAAVGLEAEAFGDLTGQQIADHVFALGRHMNGARLERGEPVGVDMGEHARGGAELQQRDVLALGLGAAQLRLDFDDLGPGEPADQVDVVHREIDDDADIRHARRERSDAGDGDRKNVLLADRLLDGLDGRIEALHMADHQGHAGAAGGRDDLAALLDRGSDRLLDQHVDAVADGRERDAAMKMGRCRDREGVDPERDQLADVRNRRAAERALDEISLLVVRIGDADEADARHLGEHAGVVVPHDAHPDDADAQRGCIGFHGFYPGHATPDS